MICMKQTERSLKEILSNLPDDKLKMLAEGIEMSPFPVLINKEYKKRFGNNNTKLKHTLKKQIRAKQLAEKKLLRSLYAEMKKFEQQEISISGLEQLSAQSIKQIQERQKRALDHMLLLTTELSKLHEYRILLEADLISDTSHK
ncbi:hypothetical protein NITUZ_40299 [Candidatus Nitrosotenuis uzonensis]|uniref:Uncharacterized protein n=2 Tax=Candidatus Nitrosotenuis uzonensis TaxID=1407055 RepID=V6AUL1_9ARCH|nr:hypothetical protein NITUZ_40299 [Candidatus Nitrosotenuis uzonensis]